MKSTADNQKSASTQSTSAQSTLGQTTSSQSKPSRKQLKQLQKKNNEKDVKPHIRVCIDGREANTTQRVGSNVYAFYVLKQLHELWLKNPRWRVTILLTEQPVVDLPPAHDRWQYEIVEPVPFWTQWAVPRYLHARKNDFDVFFTPSHYAPRLSPIPTIVTIFDLAFLEYPDQFTRKDYWQLRLWTEYSVKQAKRIITISEFSRKKIQEKYARNEDAIVIAYPAVDQTRVQAVFSDFTKQKRQSILHELNIKKPFILYLGTIQPRKNIESMVVAFEQYKKNNPKSDLQFVIAGRVGWLAQDLLERIKTSSYSNDIILTGFITEEQKWALLAENMASFQLGAQEGFGIPALEALSVGGLVITHAAASLPEVVGKSSYVLSTPVVTTVTKKAHKQTIARLVETLTEIDNLSAKQRAQKKAQARQQASTFDWKESARTISKVILDVATTDQ